MMIPLDAILFVALCLAFVAIFFLYRRADRLERSVREVDHARHADYLLLQERIRQGYEACRQNASWTKGK